MTTTIKKDFIIQRQGKDFVLYAGLLDAFHEKWEGYNKSIDTELIQAPSSANENIAVVRAAIEVCGEDGTALLKFTGIGDASPANVGRNIIPHIIRMAETRAKARALRDLLKITDFDVDESDTDETQQRNPPASSNNEDNPISSSQASRIKNLSEAVYEGGVEEMKATHLNGTPVKDLTAKQANELMKVLEKESAA